MVVMVAALVVKMETRGTSVRVLRQYGGKGHINDGHDDDIDDSEHTSTNDERNTTIVEEIKDKSNASQKDSVRRLSHTCNDEICVHSYTMDQNHAQNPVKVGGTQIDRVSDDASDCDLKT
jgi:hypothetical protein